jgi:CspA family cold shock protein
MEELTAEESSPVAGTEPVAGDANDEEGGMKGTLVRWNAARGFGFIQPAAGGDDIFVHVSELLNENLLEGDPVSYDSEFDDRKGQARAINVDFAGDGERVAPPRYNGTMLRWNTDKGFGFIKPAEKGQKDLFCHVTALMRGPGSVNQGDAVTFVTEVDPVKNQTRATQVRLVGDEGDDLERKGGARYEKKERKERGGGGRDSFGMDAGPFIPKEEYAKYDPEVKPPLGPNPLGAVLAKLINTPAR